MKIKQYVFITDSDAFLNGSVGCFSLSHRDDAMQDYGWFLCGEVEIDVKVDNDVVMQSAIDAIDAAEQKEIAAHEVKLGMLREKRANLLSITHKP